MAKVLDAFRSRGRRVSTLMHFQAASCVLSYDTACVCNPYRSHTQHSSDALSPSFSAAPCGDIVRGSVLRNVFGAGAGPGTLELPLDHALQLYLTAKSRQKNREALAQYLVYYMSHRPDAGCSFLASNLYQMVKSLTVLRPWNGNQVEKRFVSLFLAAVEKKFCSVIENQNSHDLKPCWRPLFSAVVLLVEACPCVLNSTFCSNLEK